MNSTTTKESDQLRSHFFSSLVELGDRFVDGKFDTIIPIILVDFNATFVSWIVALKFVDFRQVGVVIVPGLYNLI